MLPCKDSYLFKWKPSIRRMLETLKRSTPEGWRWTSYKEGRNIFFEFWNECPDYHAPWYGINDIVKEYGF